MAIISFPNACSLLVLLGTCSFFFGEPFFVVAWFGFVTLLPVPYAYGFSSIISRPVSFGRIEWHTALIPLCCVNETLPRWLPAVTILLPKRSALLIGFNFIDQSGAIAGGGVVDAADGNPGSRQ